MEPQDTQRPGGAGRPTPNADMQPEDTGTPRSGGEDVGGRGNAAESAMKQEHKTDEEAGSRGESNDR